MKAYSNILYLHNIKLNFSCNDYSILNSFSHQLKFPRFRTYKKYIEININLSVKNQVFPHGRGDIINSKHNTFSLNCWLNNLKLELNLKKQTIQAQLIQPSILPPETLLHLVLISPLRRILQNYNIFLVHAAVLAKADKAILICARPNQGKSTLAASFLKSGFSFLSDEFALLQENKVFSFPLKIKLDKRSRSYLKLNTYPSCFYAQEYFPTKILEYAYPQIMLFISWAPKPLKSLRIKTLNKQESFSILAFDKVNSLTYEKNILIRASQMQALAQLVQRTKNYHLSYSLSQLNQIPRLINSCL